MPRKQLQRNKESLVSAAKEIEKISKKIEKLEKAKRVVLARKNKNKSLALEGEIRVLESRIAARVNWANAMYSQMVEAMAPAESRGELSAAAKKKLDSTKDAQSRADLIMAEDQKLMIKEMKECAKSLELPANFVVAVDKFVSLIMSKLPAGYKLEPVVEQTNEQSVFEV